MSYVQIARLNNSAQGIRKKLLTGIFFAYFAVLLFFLVLANCGLFFRYESEFLSNFRLYVLLFAPTVVFAALLFRVRQTWSRVLSWFGLVCTGICGCLLALPCSFGVCKTETHYFSHDRLVQISASDQGALGDGPTSLSVGQAWGPLFYKMRNTSVDRYHYIAVGKEINGKVKLEYMVDSKAQVRDLDELLAGKPF